jgi:hypothetical protein
MISSFLDIIAQCTTAAATNYGSFRATTKNAIIQFTSKPECPSYMSISLHGLTRMGEH